MKNFDERYETALDQLTESTYKLAEVFAEEQLHNFSKWLGDKGFDSDVLIVLTDEFIAEQKS